MGKRGPKPKPTALRLLEGTTTRAAVGENGEPMPELALPAIPDGWADAAPWRPEAVAEFQRIGPELYRLGLVSELDRAALLGYADAWARVEHWTRDIAEHGSVQRTQAGWEQIRPSVTLRNQAQSDLRKFLAMFGLSPADRANVTAQPPREESPADRFFRAGK